MNFDELMVAAREGEDRDRDRSAPRSRAATWLLVASVAAILVGFGGIAATLLIASGSAAAERIGAVQAGPAPTGEPASSGSADAAAASDGDGEGDADPGADGGVAIDREWLARVAERTGIPARALTAYATASARMALERPACRLGWNTLAGIGHVESEHGTLGGGSIAADGRAAPPIVGIPLDGTSTERIADTDGGALDGDTVWDRAVGPMQFIPSTWANWGLDGDGDGIADPQDIDDAAYSAARYLCSAAGDLRDPGQWIAAVAAYNDTVEYNHRVADAAVHYASLASGL